MFEGFTSEVINVGDAEIFVRHAGNGPAVLLLHGHPRTSATWVHVAPALAQFGFTVVCPDLRGYGASSKPAATPDHAPYSKRAMAGDMSRLMERLGHRRFHAVGHDRGSYVAFRLAMDSPDQLRKLVLIDSVPIKEALDRGGSRFASKWWHWFFYAQPDIPERVINADPDAWYRGTPLHMGGEAYAEFRSATRNPATVKAMLEDYRAGLSIDYENDTADRAAGRKIGCPLLVLWTLRDDMEELYGDPRRIWQDWADDVEGHGIDSGHHVAEEAPEALVQAVSRFLRTDGN